VSEPDEKQGRRVRRAGLAILAATFVAAATMGVQWLRDGRFRESTDDAFVQGTMLLISPRVGGTVAEVPVDTNQRVHKGQLLARLDPADYEVRLHRAQADLDAAHNRMRGAVAGAQAADAERVAARVELKRAEGEARRVRGLFQRGAASKQQLDNLEAQRDAAAAKVKALEQRALAERAVLGNEAPLRQATAALREAELALSYTRITAPADGVIGRTDVSVGENLAPAQPILALARDERSWVVANFKETQIQRMRVGDPAEVRVDAFPDRVWRGHVDSVSPATGAKYALIPPDNATGNFTKIVQRVPVKIVLDACEGGSKQEPADREAEMRLPVGLSVQVNVRVGSS